MDISQDSAQQSLSLVEGAMSQTRKAILSTYASSLLILWGAIWVIGFIADHFYLAWAYHITAVLNTLGIIGSIWVCRKCPIRDDPKISAPYRITWRVFILWISLFVYIFIWLNLLAPSNGMQVSAFMATAVMFLYVVMGLWLASYFIVWLGLAVTAITLVGFYLIPSEYYCLWMGIMAGGALLGSGLYIRFRWR